MCSTKSEFESRCNLEMVELEPVPEEEQVAEQEFGHYNDLESHGRVDVMADLTTKDAERLHRLISSHAAIPILSALTIFSPIGNAIAPYSAK